MTQSASFKQTLIPILLTCGVMLPLFGALHFVMDEDSVFGALPPWFCIMLLIIGLVLLGFAVLNMIVVKNQLAQQAADDAAAMAPPET